MANDTDSDDDVAGEPLEARDCHCSTTKKIAIGLAACAAVGILLAVAIVGIPVSSKSVLAVRLESDNGPIPPGPGPGPDPQPRPFANLAAEIAAEARDVQSSHRSDECRELADAIDDTARRSRADDVEDLFEDLRDATERAIPPRSPAAEAWSKFNKRFAEIFGELFDAGKISSVASAIEALGEVVKGLRDASTRY